VFITKPHTIKYDVAIVGAGPAGISLALRLAPQISGKILLIESGGPAYSHKIAQLSELTATGDLESNFYPLHMQRSLGGTSSVWGGQCAILEERSFLNHEWPMSFGHLKPYYKDAAAILELPKSSYLTPQRRIKTTDSIQYKPYFFAPSAVRFAEKYQTALQTSQTIHVLLNATCSKIHSNKDIINAVSITDSQSNRAFEQKIKAKEFILACGGIGNAKIMLLNKLAKESPVGHYFMEHPHIYSAGAVELNKQALEPILDPGKALHALQLSDAFCLKNKLLSFTVSFRTKSIVQRPLLGIKQDVYLSRAIICSEMAPIKSNKVSLGRTKDHLDQPKTHINFKFSYQQMAQKCWNAFAKELLISGVGRTTIPPKRFQLIEGGGHLMGTTKMGISATDSVVDKNCKVHHKDNLHIIGSSVFPAGGAANPTYTIVAMALRLAEHLKNKL
jgi:choline dehydrogenase-like flavoprotein